MNFFFRFHITLKNGFEFRFVWLVIWKTDLNFVCHLKSPDTPSGLTGEFTFYAKESNWIGPGPKWVVNSPAPMICPTHTVLLFLQGMANNMMIAAKKTRWFRSSYRNTCIPSMEKENDEYLNTFQLEVTKCEIKKITNQVLQSSGVFVEWLNYYKCLSCRHFHDTTTS